MREQRERERERERKKAFPLVGFEPMDSNFQIDKPALLSPEELAAVLQLIFVLWVIFRSLRVLNLPT